VHDVPDFVSDRAGLAAELADDLGTPRDQPDLVARSEALGQGCAETFADSDNDTNLVRPNRRGIAQDLFLASHRGAGGRCLGAGTPSVLMTFVTFGTLVTFVIK
jgi:hypothetical protein